MHSAGSGSFGCTSTAVYDMISIRSPGREGEHSNVKIKALAFVLMAVLLLCGCGQKSETAAVSHSQVYFFSCVISLFTFRLVFREDYDSPLVFLSADSLAECIEKLKQ